MDEEGHGGMQGQAWPLIAGHAHQKQLTETSHNEWDIAVQLSEPCHGTVHLFPSIYLKKKNLFNSS